MKELSEKVYEEFVSIACGTWDKKVKRVLLKDLYDRLESDSDSFDNMIYEKLGMSADDVLTMIDMGDTLS